MKKYLPSFPAIPGLATGLLGLGLLAAGPALAQSQVPITATTVFGLGYNTGTQTTFIIALNPANINSTGANALLQPPGGGFSTAVTVATSSLTPGQRLVGIDARPSTGQLFALGYDYTKTTDNARLYALTLTGSTYTATPVGTALLTLDLQDPSKGPYQNPPVPPATTPTAGAANTLDFSTTPTPTVPQLYNVVFDFNPRADRIRVTAPRGSSGTNGITYVLNPNTGTSSAASAVTGSYTDSQGTQPYYVGTGAYTNSTFGVAGTTLYDLGINNTRGSVLIQDITAGTLAEQAQLTFATLQSNGTYSSYQPLSSPTTRIDLDFYYDRGSASAQKNIGYVLETRRNGTNNGYSSNLFTLDFSTGNATSGRATGKNIYGSADGASTGSSFIYDIAVLSTSPKIWIGASSGATATDWGTASNWYPSGVPTATDDVLIPGTGTFVAFAGVAVASQPTVSDARAITSLTLTNGAVLTTADGATLTLSGDFVNNDSQVAGTGTGTIALAGPAVQDISGNTRTDFWNLSVGTAGATTSGAAAIRRSLAVNGNLAIGTQAFTLLSNASGTAYVVNNGTALVTGTATVQRYITPTNPGLGYRHYSSPVRGNTVADFAATGYTPQVNPAYNTSATPPSVSPFPTIFTYDQSRLGLANSSPEFDKGYLSPTAVDNPITTAIGYVVNINASALVDFQGTLNTGPYSRTNLARGPQASAGWQLLGNPYPGAIDYDVVRANSSGLENALYVVKSTGQYSGSYSSYVNGAGNNTGTSNIPLGQGFFVRTAAGQTASVNFTDAARTKAPETGLFQRPAADLRPTLAFTVRNGSVANQARVYFEQGATSAFDAAYDAHYLPATHGLDLATDIGPEVLSINGLPLLTGTTTVPLYLHAAAAGPYTLAVDELANLPAGYHAYLLDARTNIYTDLATTPSLALALAPADAATGRYALVFATSRILASAPAALAALVSVYPNPAHGTATLVLPQALRGQAASEVSIVNALGQVVLRRTVAIGAPEQVDLPLGSLAAGLYTVRATTATGAVAKQLQVQ